MTSTTKISAKGQVVIPKDVRDELGLHPGQTLEVVRTGGGVLLRAMSSKGGRSFEEITGSIRARVNYQGPTVSIDEMNESIRRMWAGNGPRWDH